MGIPTHGKTVFILNMGPGGNDMSESHAKLFGKEAADFILPGKSIYKEQQILCGLRNSFSDD